MTGEREAENKDARGKGKGLFPWIFAAGRTHGEEVQRKKSQLSKALLSFRKSYAES
ncbi:MAG TPA: hypothetical protein VF593_00555 [Chthoniobacteraceae bacterium]